MTTVDAGFPPAARVLSADDFARVFAERRSAAAGPLVLYACPAADAARGPRLGLSVSRRVGNAVVRNRWKRRLREAFRSVRSRLPAGNDFVIVVRPGSVPAGASGARAMEEAILGLVTRVVQRPGYGAAGQPGAPPQSRRRR